MDPSLLCTNDPQLSAEPFRDSQTGKPVHEPGTETLPGLSNPAENNIVNISTEEKQANGDRLNYGSYSMPHWLESSQKTAFREPHCLHPSDTESDSLPPLPDLCNDFIPVLPSRTELYVEPKTSPVYCLKNKICMTDSKNLESVEVPVPLSDLYIFESDTQDFTLNHTTNPHKILSLEYKQISQSGVGEIDQDCDEHVPMCNLEGTETQCQSSFRRERVSENNVSGASQSDELRATAMDAWEENWMSENYVRSGKAEVMALALQRQRSDSPTELWLDACQYLTGEGAEDKGFLDHQALSNSLQESDYSDSRRVGCSPVERWSSVDSWASALSDWTGIIEDPPKDITAAFAEIGAEIDALTQAIQEAATHLQPETFGENTRATELEEKKQIMGVQDHPLKTPDFPESFIPLEQRCLSFSLDVSRPEHKDRGGSQSVETPTKELQSSQAESSPWSALQTIPGGLSPAGANSDAYQIDETLNVGTASLGYLGLPQFDRYLKSFEQDVSSSEEDHPVELKITEDVDLKTQKKQELEEEVR